MNKTNIFVLAIILASFIIGAYLFPLMPEKLASHWNAQGQVDGTMPKFWALFLMPILSVVLFVFFVLIPRIDPLKQNIAKFRKHFDRFILLFFLFLFYIFFLTISFNIGAKFNMVQFLSPAMAAIFYYAGVLSENAKPNWFIGFRTPWTLSSETVWEKTNRLGGKMFKASAAICLLGFIFQSIAFLFIIVPVLFSAVYAVFYSYFEFQKEKSKSRHGKATEKKSKRASA